MTNTLHTTTTTTIRWGGVGQYTSKRLHRSGVVLIARNAMYVGGQHGQQRKHNEVLTLREVARILKCAPIKYTNSAGVVDGNVPQSRCRYSPFTPK